MASATPRIMSQETNVCRRSWKWKSVKPASSQARSRVPDIVVAASLSIVKDPRYILSGSEPAEQAPERFVERQRSVRSRS